MQNNFGNRYALTPPEPADPPLNRPELFNDINPQREFHA